MIQTIEGAPPTTADAIANFENRQRRVLPDQYKAFLLTRNGGRPERDLFKVPQSQGGPVARIHFFFGLGDPEESCDLDWNLEVFSDRIPAHCLPIATTEGADKICLGISGPERGQVFFWDGYAGPGRKLLPVALTFDAFLDSLYRDAKSPKVPGT